MKQNFLEKLHDVANKIVSSCITCDQSIKILGFLHIQSEDGFDANIILDVTQRKDASPSSENYSFCFLNEKRQGEDNLYSLHNNKTKTENGELIESGSSALFNKNIERNTNHLNIVKKEFEPNDTTNQNSDNTLPTNTVKDELVPTGIKTIVNNESDTLSTRQIMVISKVLDSISNCKLFMQKNAMKTNQNICNTPQTAVQKQHIEKECSAKVEVLPRLSSHLKVPLSSYTHSKDAEQKSSDNTTQKPFYQGNGRSTVKDISQFAQEQRSLSGGYEINRVTSLNDSPGCSKSYETKERLGKTQNSFDDQGKSHGRQLTNQRTKRKRLPSEERHDSNGIQNKMLLKRKCSGNRHVSSSFKRENQCHENGEYFGKQSLRHTVSQTRERKNAPYHEDKRSSSQEKERKIPFQHQIKQNQANNVYPKWSSNAQKFFWSREEEQDYHTVVKQLRGRKFKCFDPFKMVQWNKQYFRNQRRLALNKAYAGENSESEESETEDPKMMSLLGFAKFGGGTK